MLIKNGDILMALSIAYIITANIIADTAIL